MRSTLLASCLLVLSFGVVGCDDGMKKDTAAPASPPVNPAPAEPGKPAMEGPSDKMAPAPSTPGETKPETPKS